MQSLLPKIPASPGVGSTTAHCAVLARSLGRAKLALLFLPQFPEEQFCLNFPQLEIWSLLCFQPSLALKAVV